MPETFGHHDEDNPEMSEVEANPNVTSQIWMRGGCGGADDSSSDDSHNPRPAQHPMKKKQTNIPLSRDPFIVRSRTVYPTARKPQQSDHFNDTYVSMTIYPWERPADYKRRYQAKLKAAREREEAGREEDAREKAARQEAARMEAARTEAAKERFCSRPFHCPECIGGIQSRTDGQARHGSWPHNYPDTEKRRPNSQGKAGGKYRRF